MKDSRDLVCVSGMYSVQHGFRRSANVSFLNWLICLSPLFYCVPFSCCSVGILVLVNVCDRGMISFSQETTVN